MSRGLSDRGHWHRDGQVVWLEVSQVIFVGNIAREHFGVLLDCVQRYDACMYSRDQIANVVAYESGNHFMLTDLIFDVGGQDVLLWCGPM